jgi:hypothetical protein
MRGEELHDPQIWYFDIYRVSRTAFWWLFAALQMGFAAKHSPTKARLDPELRLALTLEWLSGNTKVPVLARDYGVHQNTVINVIDDVLARIEKHLAPLYFDITDVLSNNGMGGVHPKLYKICADFDCRAQVSERPQLYSRSSSPCSAQIPAYLRLRSRSTDSDRPIDT